MFICQVQIGLYYIICGVWPHPLMPLEIIHIPPSQGQENWTFPYYSIFSYYVLFPSKLKSGAEAPDWQNPNYMPTSSAQEAEK